MPVKHKAERAGVEGESLQVIKKRREGRRSEEEYPRLFYHSEKASASSMEALLQKLTEEESKLEQK